MKVYEFAECCTARIIYDWQGNQGTKISYRRGEHTPQNVSSYEEYRDNWAIPELMRCCDEMIEYQCHISVRKVNLTRLGLIFNTLTSNQVYAIRFAEEVGFTSTAPIPKTKHPETELIGQYIDSVKLQAWYDSVKAEKVEQDRVFKEEKEAKMKAAQDQSLKNPMVPPPRSRSYTTKKPAFDTMII